MVFFGYFSFPIIHLELKRQIRLYALVVPLKTIPDFRPKWSKSISVFRPKRLKTHTLWGGTYEYSFYRGVSRPGLLFVTSLIPASSSCQATYKAPQMIPMDK